MEYVIPVAIGVFLGQWAYGLYNSCTAVAVRAYLIWRLARSKRK